MGIEIPDSLQWVAEYILGAGDWPDGDETAMRRLGDAWNSMADTLDTVDDDAAAALNAALTAISEGETHTALATYRDKLLDGDEAAFPAIAKYCRYQAELLDDGANDIEHTKLVIIGTMIVAAVEIGVALATAWTGVGAAAGVAARVAAQVSVRIAVKQLIARMLTRGAMKAAARAALRGAFFEALEEGGIDAIARTIQVGKGDRGTDEFGWSDLGLATFAGAVGGAVGGGLGTNLDGLSDAATSKLGRFATDTATGTGTELAADLSAQAAAAAITGQDLQIGLDTFTSAGAGGIQSAVESSGHPEAPSTPDLGELPPTGTDSPDTEADTPPPETDGPTTPPDYSADTDTTPAGNETSDTDGSTSTPDPSADTPTGTQRSSPGSPTSIPNSPADSPPGAHSSPADNLTNTRNPPADTETPIVGNPAPYTYSTAIAPDATSSTTIPAESPPDSLAPDSPDNARAPQPTFSDPTDAQPSSLNASPDSTPAPVTPTESAAPQPTTLDYSAPTEPAPANTPAEPTEPPTATPSPASPSPAVTPASPAPADTTTASTAAPNNPATTPVSTPSTAPHQPPTTTAPPVSNTTTPASPGPMPEAARSPAHRATPTNAVAPSRPSRPPVPPTVISGHAASANPVSSPQFSANQRNPGTSPIPPASPEQPNPASPAQSSTPAHPRPPSQHPARVLRETLRNLPSHDGRNPAIDVRRPAQPQRPPAYRLRRFHLGDDQWVAVADITVRITETHLLSPEELHQAMEDIQADVDETFNNGGRLLSGDQLLVDVRFVTDPTTVDLNLSADASPDSTAELLREHIGLAPAVTNSPLSSSDLRAISNDIAHANTGSPLDNPAESRIISPFFLREVETPAYQHDVEDSLRDGNRFDRMADPRTHPYGNLINDGGPGVTGRRNNCLDCSLSALSSFYGVPQVSAPRWPDEAAPDPENPHLFEPDEDSGEELGMERAADWLGGSWLSYSGMPVHAQFQALHDYVAGLGPGSSAIVTTWFPELDENDAIVHDAHGLPEIAAGHTTVLVYPQDAAGPVWWDPQLGSTTDTPPAYLVDIAIAMECIPIDANGGAIDAGTGTDQGTSQTATEPGVWTQPGVPHQGEQARLGLPADSAAGAGAPIGSGPGQPGDQQAHGRDHRPQQSAAAGDGGEVRRGDRSGQPATGFPDLPATTPNPSDPAFGEHGDDRVPNRSDFHRRPRTPGTDPAGLDH